MHRVGVRTFHESLHRNELSISESYPFFHLPIQHTIHVQLLYLPLWYSLLLLCARPICGDLSLAIIWSISTWPEAAEDEERPSKNRFNIPMSLDRTIRPHIERDRPLWRSAHRVCARYIVNYCSSRSMPFLVGATKANFTLIKLHRETRAPPTGCPAIVATVDRATALYGR